MAKLPKQAEVFARHLLVYARTGQMDVQTISAELSVGKDRYVFSYNWVHDMMHVQKCHLPNKMTKRHDIR